MGQHYTQKAREKLYANVSSTWSIFESTKSVPWFYVTFKLLKLYKGKVCNVADLPRGGGVCNTTTGQCLPNSKFKPSVGRTRLGQLGVFTCRILPDTDTVMPKGFRCTLVYDMDRRQRESNMRPPESNALPVTRRRGWGIEKWTYTCVPDVFYEVSILLRCLD